jgi:SnoaL-like domain
VRKGVCIVSKVENFEIEQIVNIQNVLSRIAHAVDFGTLEEYGALLSPDFRWEFPGTHAGVGLGAQVRKGRGDAIEGARERRGAGMQGPGTHTRHVINSTAVTPDAHAPTSLTYWHYYEQTDQSPVLTAMGIYVDEFARGDATQWVLRSRRIVIN